MRFIYATDLHGNRMAIEQMLALVTREQVDAVVFGGDLTPKLTAIRLAEHLDPEHEGKMIGGEILPVNQIKRIESTYYPALQEIEELNHRTDNATLVAELEQKGYLIHQLTNAYYAFDMLREEQVVLERLHRFFSDPKYEQLVLNTEELSILQDGVLEWMRAFEKTLEEPARAKFVARFSSMSIDTLGIQPNFENLAPSVFLWECVLACLAQEKIVPILNESADILRRHAGLPLGKHLIKEWKRIQERMIFSLQYAQYIEPMMISGVADFSTVAQLKREAEDIEAVQQGQYRFLRGYFFPLIQEWRNSNANKPVYAMLGNDDVLGNILTLQEGRKEDILRSLDYSSLNWMDLKENPPFVGYGFVASLPPETTYRAWLKPEEKILENLRKLRKEAGSDQTIWSIHNPPYGCLDQFSENGRAGSHAVRQFIEETQPSIALFGHIHEAARLAGSCSGRIGKTLCINPGAEHEDGVQAVIVNTDSIEVEKVFRGEMEC